MDGSQGLVCCIVALPTRILHSTERASAVDSVSTYHNNPGQATHVFARTNTTWPTLTNRINRLPQITAQTDDWSPTHTPIPIHTASTSPSAMPRSDDSLQETSNQELHAMSPFTEMRMEDPSHWKCFSLALALSLSLSLPPLPRSLSFSLSLSPGS